MVPAEGRPNILKLKSSTEGAEAKFWLSASNIGRRGGGGPREGYPPLLLRCTAVLTHHWGGGSRAGRKLLCGGGMPSRLALCVRETVAGHRLGSAAGGGAHPLPMHVWKRGGGGQRSWPRARLKSVRLGA